MMFKLPYGNFVKEQIANTSVRHGWRDVVGLAEAIFGIAADSEPSKATSRPLKSRVSFDTSRCISDDPKECVIGLVLLGSPKLSYYLNYVRQPASDVKPDSLDGDAYATYSNLPSAGKPEVERPELRGWKRYPVRSQINSETWERKDEPAMTMKLHALEPETHFKGEVRFHNLKPAELGALLWVFEWGGDGELRHFIGMGKPFGMGQISVCVGNLVLFPNNKDDFQAQKLRANVDRCDERASSTCLISIFEKHMQAVYCAAAGPTTPGNMSWKESEQIVQLFAIAYPDGTKSFGSKNLRHMVLSTHPHRNDFQTAKGARGNRKLILRPYADFNGTSDHDLFPRR